MPTNTNTLPTAVPLTATFTNGEDTWTFAAPISTAPWPTVSEFRTTRRAPRRTRLEDIFAESLTTQAPKTKFTWESWLILWGKIAEAHEKRVYLIPDEPPTSVTPPVPEPVVALTPAPRYNYTAYADSYYDEWGNFPPF